MLLKAHFNSVRELNVFLKGASGMVYDMVVPSNISVWWNFGSLIGICLMSQVVSGILLAMHYCPSIAYAFESVAHISRDVNYGWLFRGIHANGGSLFFLCLYLHIGRGLYYGSYMLKRVWFVGVVIFFLSMMTAFLGYVLPWGQMSYWGATVITNMVTAVPYLGESLVKMIWGGFSVGDATLNRFFVIHFILPMIIMVLVIVHLIFLHDGGSNNPVGVKSYQDSVAFHLYFTIKDTTGFIVLLMCLSMMVFWWPYMLLDPQNFIPADPLKTPVHIQPEWYFLFAYTILRSVPNKMGGVIALVMSIFILFFFPLIHSSKSMVMSYNPISQVLFWWFFVSFLILSWIGACPVAYPFQSSGVVVSWCYFSFVGILPLIQKTWNIVIGGSLNSKIF
uniref:Cytochrome b n=1 Tax=Tropidomya abbreviata TaxID=102404 RepID=A0A1U9XPK6_9BIVA|nr:cytochrome b [Tropidomya abbreviata]AQZ26173.1 cytochrome b [Tropidomya abbreviata]